MSTRTNIMKWGGIALLVLVLLAAFLVALIAAFDWNHAKPWINRRVSEATGRPFAIHGDLSVEWQTPPASVSGWRRWVPWPQVRAQDITLGNPDWVDATPHMVKLKQLTTIVAPLPLLRKHLIIPTLQLDLPRVYLQRVSQERNNWTFKQDDGAPSAWEFKLDHLVLHKGTLHVVDALRKAEVRAQIDTPDGDTGITWTISGSLAGDEVSGNGKAGRILSLQDAGTRYPVQANLQVGKTKMQAQGTLTNPQQLAALDLQLKLSGVNLAHLYRITGVVLPETSAYATEGHLTVKLNAEGGDWRYEKFKGKVGSSDIAGTLEYLSREPRSLLKGNVESRVLRFADLAPLIGADSNADKIQRGAEPVQPKGKALPVEKFNTAAWTSIDADVRFSGRKIIRKKQLPIDNLVTHLMLKNGVLTLAPLNFGVAGGTLTSTITLDGSTSPINAKMKVSARRLQLKRLFPAFEPMQTSLGQINGEASLSSTGDSVAALLGGASGEVKAVIDRGTVSKLLLETMGLNVGNIILTKLFGDEQVTLNCLASDFKVTKGVMDTRVFVVDTEDATVHVDGKINLAQEKLDLVVQPQSKGVRVVSLRAPLYVTGSFKKPDVDVDKGVLALKAGSAIALGVLAPAATALLPLVNMGPGKDSPCAALLAQAKEKPVAPPPGKSAQR